MNQVWGGATYPQLRYYDEGHSASRLYTTEDKGLPQVKLAIQIEQTNLALNRLVSEEIRRRHSRYLMHFQLSLRLPGNLDLLDFIYEAMRLNAPLYLRPHPACLFWPPPHAASDEWQVVIEGPFDWSYFNDKWVGHDVVLKLVATETMQSPPLSIAGSGFVPVAYAPVAGVQTPTDESTGVYWGERLWAGPYDAAGGSDQVAYWEL
jgi:hypothetical protein